MGGGSTGWQQPEQGLPVSDQPGMAVIEESPQLFYPHAGGDFWPTEDFVEAVDDTLVGGEELAVSSGTADGVMTQLGDVAGLSLEEERAVDVDVFGSPEKLLPHLTKGVSYRGGSTGNTSDGLVVHKLMHVTADKLDLSFVEKVIIPAHEIRNLCNDITPSAASLRDGRSQLDFELLNKTAMQVVGLYGSKQVLIDIFSRLGLLCVVTLLTAEKLEAGIYGFQNDKILYVFYWHQGQRMNEASRKDVSCNFIRYVMDLCGTVYLCLDGKDMEASLETRGHSSAATRKQRTQRLQISVIKESENDLKMSKGFHICPSKVLGDGWLPGAQTVGLIDLRPRLSSSLHRCAVLTATRCLPRIAHHKQFKRLGVQQLPELVQGWSSKYNVDVMQLPDADLIILVEYGDLEGSNFYRSLIEDAKLKREAHRQKFSKMEELLTTEEGKVLSIFERARQAYLELSHPWEETFLRNTASSSPVDEGQKCAPGSAEQGESQSTSSKASPESQLLDTHIALSKLWSRESGTPGSAPPSLLLVGSEISINLENGNMITSGGVGQFEIRSPNSKHGPILYGEEFVLLKGAGALGLFNAYTMEGVGVYPNGPVLSSQYVRIEVRGNSTLSAFFKKMQKTQRLKLVLRGGSPKGMRDWMASYKTPVFPSLDKRVVDLAFVIANPALFGPQVSQNTYSNVLRLSKSDDALLQFQKIFSEEKLHALLSKAKQAQPDYSSERRQDYLRILDSSQTAELIRVCKKVYGEACSQFSKRITCMVKDFITPMIKQRLELEKTVGSASLEKTFQTARSEFLMDLRSRLSIVKLPDKSTLAVTNCTMHSKRWYHLQDLMNSGDDEVELRFVTEEVESERVSWKMAELSPMKKDLDALLQNETYLVVPQCSTNYKLIDVDPKFERLSLVFPMKSGEVFVFVEDDSQSAVHLYLLPKLGPELQASNPIKTFRRGWDLVAVDEAVRLVAFYDKTLCKISIFRFDESFRHFEWGGIDIVLSDYAGSRTLRSMMFIPGKREILLVDSDLKVRVCEISQPAMMRPRHILLQDPNHKMCISPDGSCLLVFYSSEASPSSAGKEDVLDDSVIGSENDSQEVVECNDDKVLKLDVYLLDGTMSLLKTLTVDDISGDVRGIDVSTVAFGSQSHLVLIDTLRPDRGICSQLLEVTSASEVCQLQELSKTGRKDDIGSKTEVQKNASCPALEYVHHVFDKYAASPPLISGERELCVHVVLEDDPQSKKVQFKEICTRYLDSCIEKLKRDKGKSFCNLSLSFASDFVGRHIFKQTLLGSMEPRNCVPMGDWVRLLVSLVPIQIARAENNGLRPLIDGLQISSNLNYADAVGLAEAIRFGFYDAVLTQWKGPIKVISSMGKQSSGKSYLLNHLSGSLLDVAGGRCTDGVWMTMRASKSCLYVLLDFEGLGSFERSEQEDMLLSILNAAVSNITIFNKKDFHLDKETESVFQRFQNGVSIIKEDSRLFKGLFYMAIKDVDTADIEDLKAEFYTKIQQICSKSQDNFLTKMYGGEVEVAAMPPFQRTEYHDSVADIAAAVEDIKPIHHGGKSLMVDLKLVIAQISARDWSPLDTKRIALRLEILRKHFMTAVNLGRLASDSDNLLVNFETQEPVADSSLVVEGRTFSLGDTGLELSPRQESQVMGDVLENLRQQFQNGYRRTGDDDEVWHSTYEKFLMAVADRRKQRVLEWLTGNTSEFQDDGDVQKLLLETVVVLAELKQRLSLCSSKCKVCFLRCVREKSHPAGTSVHSCLGSHRCAESCSFCLMECPGQIGYTNCCADLSGHEGPHDCKQKSHTCGQDCQLLHRSSNCNASCALKPGHAGDHMCNTIQHICDQGCSLSGCNNSCVIPLDSGDHDLHFCQDRMCPMDCTMEGCNRKCGSEDHFHSLSSNTHLCGNEHTCPGKCESPGICQITTEVVKVSKTFRGKRSVFEYEHVSEQNGIRKACCIAIPPGEETHCGDHCHTTNPNAVHLCETKCRACGYFCNLPIGHPGVHDTTHGNMRDVHFAAETDQIDLEDRKYEWGESGLAEMCMMHCKAQGRGHIHLIRCLAHANPKGPCAEGLYEGARHQSQEYGPDKAVAKDELSHAAYWKQMRFKDPCNDEDQKQFQLCNHFCRSDEHVPAATSGKNATQSRSYCTEKLWHTPVSRTGSVSSTGYVTEDGHSFACDHLKNTANHVVFVIDRSGSMGSSDIKPTLAKFAQRFNNRLGCVYEAIVRFIVTRRQAGQPDVVSIVLFDRSGSIAVERQPISEHLVDLLLPYSVGGGTTYSSGLTLAEKVLHRGLYDSSMQAKHPAVVFLSDGGNNGGSNPLSIIKDMKDIDHRLVFHTILFGRDHVDQDILRRMATAGDGSFQVSIDEVQLAKSFEGLAKSLRPKVASLM